MPPLVDAGFAEKRLPEAGVLFRVWGLGAHRGAGFGVSVLGRSSPQNPGPIDAYRHAPWEQGLAFRGLGGLGVWGLRGFTLR